MYYPMYFDPTYILVLIGVVICLIASAKMNSTFSRYSRVRNHSGMTGRDAAEQILHREGLYDVRIEHISGNLTDHYDPRTKTLRLSDATYNSTSVAALGVAAHECGACSTACDGICAAEVKKQPGAGGEFRKFDRVAVNYPWIFLQQQYDLFTVHQSWNPCIFTCSVIPDCDITGGI